MGKDDFDILMANKKLAIMMGYQYYPFVPGSNIDPGWKTSEDVRSYSKVPRDAYLCRSHLGLTFHSDWNDLMKAWRKLKGFITAHDWVDDSDYKRMLELFCSFLINGDRTSAFTELVKILDWYNEKNIPDNLVESKA